MKVPIFSGKRSRIQWTLPLVLVALLLFGGTVALASSGEGEHGETGAKGWVATDTYRVMNFAVLAIGLFLVLKRTGCPGTGRSNSGNQGTAARPRREKVGSGGQTG